MCWRAVHAAGAAFLVVAVLCCNCCWGREVDSGHPNGHHLRALAIPVSLEEHESTTAALRTADDGERFADLVVLEDSASVNVSVADQVLNSVDPVWLRLGLPADSFLTWSGCGGWFRPHWRLLTSEVPELQREEMERIFHESSAHLRCGDSVLMYRLGGHLPSHHQGSVAELGRRIVMSIGTLTSSRYPWTAATPLHERPVGAVALLNGSVAHLVADHDTLCTQHLVQLLNPTHSRRNCDHVFSSLLPSIPFLLSTRWHQFVLSVALDRNGLLTVTRRLLFVIANQEQTAWWSHVEQAGATSRGDQLRHRRSLSDSRDSLTNEPPWRVTQDVEHTDDRQGVFTVRVCRAVPPGTSPPSSASSQRGKRGPMPNLLRTRLLVWLPASWVKPILHRVSTSASGASLPGEASLVGYHYDRDLATALLYFSVRFSEQSVDHASSGGEPTQCVSVRIPYETVFTPLSARPPDAHKRYLLPQSMLQVPVACGSADAGASPPFAAEEIKARAETLQQLFALPGDGPRRQTTRCYRYYRAQPSASSISLPVPDGAMVFNVVSIGMLPFAAMVGAVLRRTGRRTE